MIVSYSNWHEFGLGSIGQFLASVAFTAYNVLMMLLIAIAVNRYYAIARPVQVCTCACSIE